MFARLHHHPISIEAYFRYSLVLTYAFPETILQPLLPPGLRLDSYDDCAFLAIALVQTEGLGPTGVPRALGLNFFLSGYRIFTRYRHQDGRELRGLLILRSDSDSRLMVTVGNFLTGYNFRKCVVKSSRTADVLEIDVQTSNREADLFARAQLRVSAAVPYGSPFPDVNVARHFAGPLPFTFNYDQKAKKMVIVKAVRENWKPAAVNVEVGSCTFLEAPPFNAVAPRLANAFFVENIRYRWQPGVVVPATDS